MTIEITNICKNKTYIFLIFHTINIVELNLGLCVHLFVVQDLQSFDFRCDLL